MVIKGICTAHADGFIKIPLNLQYMKKLSFTEWDEVRNLYKPSENQAGGQTHNEESCSELTKTHKSDLFSLKIDSALLYTIVIMRL